MAQNLERAFAEAKEQCLAFIRDHNTKLPQSCPHCGTDGFVPGLRCSECGEVSSPAWAILRDTEWGYEAIPLTNRRKILARFEVENW